MKPPPCAAALLLFVLALQPCGRAAAQSASWDGRSDPAVHTVVVVGDQQVSDRKGPPESSGLTVQAVSESEAEHARRDAVDIKAAGSVQHPSAVNRGEVDTTVAVKAVVSESSSRNAKACVQIGVIGSQADCRPK